MVWLRDQGAPPVSAAAFESREGEADLKVAIAQAAPGQARRVDWRARPSLPGVARNAVRNRLVADGIPEEDIRLALSLGFLAVRVTDDSRLSSVIDVLLKHPHVDWIEASQARGGVSLGPSNSSGIGKSSLVRFGGPSGSNPLDDKHTVHDVADYSSYSPDAWDYTKGENVKIGVMDTGIISHSDGYWPDVTQAGFVDVWYNPWSNFCTAPGQSWQEAGLCLGTADDPHGVTMVSLIAARDNNTGVVGIAPSAKVYSLKVEYVPAVVQQDPDHSCQGNDPRLPCFDDDAMVFAVDYTIDQGMDVLSMSFVGGFSGSFENALNAAYNADVFLVAGTRNAGGSGGQEPANYTNVLGVGAVTRIQLTSHDNDDSAEEVSGYGGGGHFQVTGCLPLSARDYGVFCTENGVFTRICSTSNLESCSTSFATANVAGIVGLVRSVHPSETNAQIKSRIVNNTIGGSNKVVQALAAILDGAPSLNASILGPDQVSPMGYCSWNASASGGTPPYSYTWSGVLSGTGSSVSGSVSSSGTLKLDVTDSGNPPQTKHREKFIAIDWNLPPWCE